LIDTAPEGEVVVVVVVVVVVAWGVVNRACRGHLIGLRTSKNQYHSSSSHSELTQNHHWIYPK